MNLNLGPNYEQVTNWILNQTHAALYFTILSILLTGILIILIFVSQRFKYSRILFIICSIATIFIFRGLSLYADSYNPDEGQHLANAIALSHDGRFWVATDTTTFGPVSAVIILIAHKIISIFFPSFGITYFLLRLINIIIISISFVLLLKIFEARLFRKTAWIISLFYVIFFCFYWNSYLLSFNSEYTYILFISISLYAIYEFQNKNNIFQLVTAGFALGIMPFIKLQTLPMCFVLAIWCFYEILKNEYISLGKRKVRKHYAFLVYIGMAALPTIFLFIYCLTYTNGIKNAFFYYILNAKSHLGKHTLNQYVDFFITKLFPWLFSHIWFSRISIISLLAFIVSFALILTKKVKIKACSNWIFSFMLLLFSVEAVTQPMRLFRHYIIFLVVPAIVFYMETVVLLAAVEYKRIMLPKLYIPKAMKHAFRKDNVITFCLVILTFVLFANYPKNVLRETVLSDKRIIGYENTYLTQASQYIVEHTVSDDYIVVWGWEQRVLVFANRKSGTAQTDIQRLYPPYSPINIDMYISDIKKNKPKLIIDVVAPESSIYSNKDIYGLENHIQVWPAICNDYTMTDTLPAPDGSTYRVYTRNL